MNYKVSRYSSVKVKVYYNIFVPLVLNSVISVYFHWLTDETETTFPLIHRGAFRYDTIRQLAFFIFYIAYLCSLVCLLFVMVDVLSY